jgi:hypothetical protein
MSRNVFGIEFPSEKAFKMAKDFILKYPSATHKEYLRRFATRYGDKISTKKFVDALVHLFDALGGVMSELFVDLPKSEKPQRKEKCGSCVHIEKWEYGSTRCGFYCNAVKSKKTTNGLLKVKCKNTACDLFKVSPRFWV